VVDAKPLIH